MPVLFGLAGTLFGASVGVYLADMLIQSNLIWETDWYIRYIVKKAMMDSKYCMEFPAAESMIENKALIDKIVGNLIGESFGLFVFAAPTGSGKSTFIKMAIRKIQELSNGNQFMIKLCMNGGQLLEKRSLHDHFKIPLHRPLSRYIPRGSIIILDHADVNPQLPHAVGDYLTELATDSANSKRYKIVVCVSNAILASRLIALHSGEKVHKLCCPSALQWSEVQAMEYMIENKISETSRMKLLEIVRKSYYSPGLLCLAAKRKSFKDDLWQKIDQDAKRIQRSWKEYEQMDLLISKSKANIHTMKTYILIITIAMTTLAIIYCLFILEHTSFIL